MKPLSKLDPRPVPKPASPHSRFIPREEIGGVAAWEFAAVDGSEAAAPRRGKPAAESVSAEVLQAAREQAYHEGFAHGHDAGSQEVRDALEASLRRAAEETAVRLGLVLNTTRDQLKRNEVAISRHILDLACEVARQVVRRELQADPQALLPVVQEALRELVDDSLPATLRLHPDDLAVMKGALQETLGDDAPALVADTSITPGGCRVESAATTVDATLEKRWLRAVGNLGLETPWHAGDEDV